MSNVVTSQNFVTLALTLMYNMSRQVKKMRVLCSIALGKAKSTFSWVVLLVVWLQLVAWCCFMTSQGTGPIGGSHRLPEVSPLGTSPMLSSASCECLGSALPSELPLLDSSPAFLQDCLSKCSSVSVSLPSYSTLRHMRLVSFVPSQIKILSRIPCRVLGEHPWLLEVRSSLYLPV